MSYIQEIVRLAANTKYQKEAISIAVAFTEIIDKLREEGDKSHLTTAITAVIAGIMQPPIGRMISIDNPQTGTVLSYPVNLTNYDADMLTGWYIPLDTVENDMPGVKKKLEEQPINETALKNFKIELLKHLNTILHPVRVLDISIIPEAWVSSPDTPESRVAISIVIDTENSIQVTSLEDDDFSIVDDEHVQ